jgi:large subunit ribosomal protein L22
MKDSRSKIQDPKIVVAKASFVRLSPRKLRLIVDAIAGMDPNKAIDYLKVLPKRGAKIILEVFQQGLANAKNNFQVSPGDLTVVSLQVGEGPRGPKRIDKSHGARFDRGIKRRRLAHITLKLAAKEASHGSES